MAYMPISLLTRTNNAMHEEQKFMTVLTLR
jgi:hypothetical protein